MTTAQTQPASTPAHEKQAARFDEWMAGPDLQFSSPEAETAYRQRIQLFRDAVQLRKPERVPVAPNFGHFAASYGGLNARQAMYEYDRLGDAMRKFHADFQPDWLAGSAGYTSGPVLEMLDYKLYRWPGGGLDDNTSYQCVETEYMQASEYDALIADPSNFFLRSYYPRIFGALDGLRHLPTITDNQEIVWVAPFVVPFGQPEVRASIQKLLDAGEEAARWLATCRAIDRGIISEFGIPSGPGGYSKAPFDTIGDTLRGTRGMMLDMFRQPQKVLAAVEHFVPIAIEMGVRAATASRRPIVTLPLHKGADGFMSNRDFLKFYWPTLRAVIHGLIAEGVVPMLFVEGAYDQRLDFVADSGFPAGTTIWLFDRTDMKEAKKKIGGWGCIAGNVPVSLLNTGTPAQVSDYVERLIDDVGYDGGFILGSGAVMDSETRPENVHALIDTGKKHGVYR